MHALIETILFVFGLVALGYLAALTGFLKLDVGEALTHFAVGVGLPMLLFRTVATATFGGDTPWALWITYFSSVFIAWGVAFFTLKRAFGRDDRTAMTGGLASGFSNLLMLGIPLSLGVYGQQGFTTLSLIISIHLPIMMGLSILLFELMRPKDLHRPGMATVLLDFGRKLLSNAIVIGILAGLIWRFSGVPIPSFVMRFVDAFANAAVPVALFAMGLSLRRFGIGSHLGPVLCLVGFKLFLMPAAALVIALLLGMPPLSAKVAVLAAAIPSGINPYLIATRFGTGQALTSNTMTMSTAFAVVTTVFWLFVAEHVFT
ncbi:AEC family transporter [Tianweitania populi]|uniref:Transporter n=1 Tax=Tianweitania populi TaxID=1607949 RepID=A0A8J3GJQ0_9HYPH|nr:AEC family transporter [Tianweitania populi]GHD10328.1 transporter [Tianweitania populi]